MVIIPPVQHRRNRLLEVVRLLDLLTLPPVEVSQQMHQHHHLVWLFYEEASYVGMVIIPPVQHRRNRLLEVVRLLDLLTLPPVEVSRQMHQHYRLVWLFYEEAFSVERAIILPIQHRRIYRFLYSF